MLTQDADILRAAHSRNPTPITTGLAYPLTPPPEQEEARAAQHGHTWSQDATSVGHIRGVVDDNTAAGMALLQEESLYSNHETMPEEQSIESQAHSDKEKVMIQDLILTPQAQILEVNGDENYSASTDGSHLQSEPPGKADCHQQQCNSVQAGCDVGCEIAPCAARVAGGSALCRTDGTTSADKEPQLASSLQAIPQTGSPARFSPSLASYSDYGTKPWDFSNIQPNCHYPSSLLHPGSRFEGTQQSDRQIYNVTVTVHTLDVSQCTLSGYLKIEGLTPDHPTLTTFFNGEIIGGPDQKHSFKTQDPSWGASDKTDLMHWARFAAWKPVSREAKRDINFQYPMPGTGLNGNDSWTQQEHIFMRWKESFLVPDHRVRSIQGASFDGFYYICFNQIEGKISGIYFHARSEKYQQLELKHEGEQGVWNRGVRPAMEFR